MRHIPRTDCLLLPLQSYRNTVPVPRHWSQKRKYLQGKRGIEKPAFQLPSFIEATGISDMRTAYAEKEEAKKLKQKQRDRMTVREWHGAGCREGRPLLRQEGRGRMRTLGVGKRG